MGRTGYLRKQPAALPGNAGQKGADMSAEEYRAELELQYSVTELEAEQESGG